MFYELYEQGRSRDPQGDFPGTLRDPQGPSRDPHGTPQWISRDAPGMLQNVLLDVATAMFDEQGRTRNPQRVFQRPLGITRDSPGTFQGSTRHPQGTSRHAPGISRELPGTHRDLQGAQKQETCKPFQFSCSIPGKSRTCLLLQPQQCFATMDPPGALRDPQGPSRDLPEGLK